MWLVKVVSVNKQLSVKKFCLKNMISMIKAKLSFFWTSNSEDHGFHSNKGTILFWSSVNFSISVISTKLYFVEIGWVHQKLSIFKCTMLKTLNSDFLDWEDTLNLTEGNNKQEPCMQHSTMSLIKYQNQYPQIWIILKEIKFYQKKLYPKIRE